VFAAAAPRFLCIGLTQFEMVHLIVRAVAVDAAASLLTESRPGDSVPGATHIRHDEA
jgi:hypothetical protein